MEQADRKNRTTLLIVGGILALCICSVIGIVQALRTAGKTLEKNVMITDPEEMVAIANEICDYDLPTGYQEVYASNLFVSKIVAIGPEDTASTGSKQPLFMFMQFTSAIVSDDEESEQQLRASMERAMQRQELKLEYVGESTVTIRQQEVTLTTYEGVDDEGTEMREVISSVFDGKGGPAMLMVAGTIEGWDQELVDTFMESIR